MNINIKIYLFITAVFIFLFYAVTVSPSFAETARSCWATEFGKPPVGAPLLSECKQSEIPGAPRFVAGKVPLYKQWDRRWKSNSYGCGNTMSQAACGPTSLAMVISYHLEKTILPPETAALAISHGWRICGNGTAWTAMTGIPRLYGLKSKGISWTEAKKYLALGLPIIQSQGCYTNSKGKCIASGWFTSGGHFIVITGISGDGRTFYINDPDGKHRTQATEKQITDTLKGQWVIYSTKADLLL